MPLIYQVFVDLFLLWIFCIGFETIWPLLADYNRPIISNRSRSKIHKTNMDLLTECCDKFREMVYNYCSLFMQQMLPQVDGLTYPIQHRFTQSMNFIIQCISKFFTVAKLHDSCQILITDNFGQNIFEQVKKCELYANICQLLEFPFSH